MPLDILRRLTRPVDAQSVLENPLFGVAQALSPDVRAQVPHYQRLALMQEEERRRQQVEDFYQQLAGGSTPSAQAGGGGAAAPVAAPPSMGGLIAPPAAQPGEVDVFAGLAGGQPMGGMAAPQPNFTAAAAPTPPSPAPTGSPADTETLARQMIASGIPEIANQGISLLSRIEAQQAAGQRTQEGFFAPFVADDGRTYLPSKAGGPAIPLTDSEGNQLVARNPYDIRSVAGGVQAIDPLTGRAQTVFTPEEVGRGEGLAQAATQRETDRAQARLDLPQLEQQTNEAFALIDRLAPGGDLNKGFMDAYGFKRPGFTVLEGAERRDAASAVRQLTSRLTLEEASKLAGVLSDSDIALAAGAATRLADTSISDREAAKALQDIRDVLTRGRDNLRRRASEAQPSGRDELLKRYGL